MKIGEIVCVEQGVIKNLNVLVTHNNHNKPQFSGLSLTNTDWYDTIGDFHKTWNTESFNNYKYENR